MKVTVIGCGRWGSFLAWYLDRMGHSVSLYGRESSNRMRALLQSRSNDLLTLPERICLTTRLEEIGRSDAIFVSVDSQHLRALLRDEAAPYLHAGQIVVLCMKGLEIGSGKRLSTVAEESLPEDVEIAVWLGPGHVQEFCRGVPNCMVIDSNSKSVKERLVSELSGGLIRFYYGQDLIGNEIGAAAKNVVGIAAGFLDGLMIPTLKGALMSRGAREVSRLIGAMGGNPVSAYGLCHLGDYEATVFSPHSHNRRFGEAYVKGETYSDLAEGYYTAKAICQLADSVGVEVPICSSVERVLYQGVSPQEELKRLFGRSLKNEF